MTKCYTDAKRPYDDFIYTFFGAMQSEVQGTNPQTIDIEINSNY